MPVHLYIDEDDRFPDDSRYMGFEGGGVDGLKNINTDKRLCIWLQSREYSI